MRLSVVLLVVVGFMGCAASSRGTLLVKRADRIQVRDAIMFNRSNRAIEALTRLGERGGGFQAAGHGTAPMSGVPVPLDVRVDGQSVLMDNFVVVEDVGDFVIDRVFIGNQGYGGSIPNVLESLGGARTESVDANLEDSHD